jgi:hypothetical protein
VKSTIERQILGHTEGQIARIPRHREREYLEAVLQMLRGADRALYGSALAFISHCTMIPAENVPPGLVERVAELMGDRKTRHAGHGALKNLVLWEATTNAQEETIFRAERRRLQTIFDDLMAGKKGDFGREITNVQVWGKYNPTLASLFEPRL